MTAFPLTPAQRLSRYKSAHGADWRDHVPAKIKSYLLRSRLNIGAAGRGLCWIERPEDIGLRLVGFADEIAKPNYAYAHGIGHTGWWTDDDGFGETMRGVVYQLPGKHGRARYVAGYAEPYNDGAARLCFDVIEGERGENEKSPDYREAARDAAYQADSIAEHAAEAERDYNRAWRAGDDARCALEEASDTRRELIEALAEHRKVKHIQAPALCKAFKSWVREQVAFIRDRQNLARSLRDDYGHCDGFAEGTY